MDEQMGGSGRERDLSLNEKVASRLARKFTHVIMNPVTEGLKELARKHIKEIIEAESQTANQQQLEKDENTAPKA